MFLDGHFNPSGVGKWWDDCFFRLGPIKGARDQGSAEDETDRRQRKHLDKNISQKPSQTCFETN